MSIDFSNIELPFTAGDLLASGGELLGVVGQFVLLVLAFIAVRLYLIPLMVNAIGARRSDVERDAYGNRIRN